MKLELVKWEMELLLKVKAEVESQGRTFSYGDTNRLDELRQFVDDQTDGTESEKSVPEKIADCPF